MPEAAAGLELRSDGSFAYGLTTGSLDEQADGSWRQERKRVLLTTTPRPRPPVFTLVAADPGTPGALHLRLENPAGRPIPDIRVEVTMSDGSRVVSQTGSDWLELPLDGLTPVALGFTIPVYERASPVFPIAGARRYRFLLDPADLGVRDFQDTPLEISGELLTMPGAAAGQGFKRVDPRD